MINAYKSEIGTYIEDYRSYFQCGNHTPSLHRIAYIEGLLHHGKSNIERMEEQVLGSEYQKLHHFISESPWDALGVMGITGQKVSSRLSEMSAPKGLIFDESGWEKSGKMSVGVGRQYIGNIGKVCNSVNGVFGGLCSGGHVGLIGGRLYLPQEWTSDKARCSKAGIPEDWMQYRSKPELAIDIYRNLPQSITFDWVGGDAIYGKSPYLRHYLEDAKQAFVLDVGDNLGIYLTDPTPFIPAKKTSGRGRTPTQYKTTESKVILKDFFKQIKPDEWETITHRKGTKGDLVRKTLMIDVYVWDSEYDNRVEKLRLLISTEIDGTEVKFSLCYQPEGELDLKTALFRQMQRYFVERAFQNAKEQLGMHQYQVRTWMAWYHHIALTFMALDFLLQIQLDMKEELPLISCNDVKLIIANSLDNKLNSMEGIRKAINIRHQKRHKDLLFSANST